MDDYSICQACPHRGRKVRQVSKATGDTWLADCNQRRVCPRAARRYRLGIAERFNQAEWQVKIELTMPTERRTVTAENIEIQSLAWEKFRRRLKRQLPTPFHWAWVREQADGDNLHFHVLLDYELKDTELAETAMKAGFGSQFSLKEIHEKYGGSKGAIGYTTKSLENVAGHTDGKWPHGTRLYRTSVPKLPGKRKGNFDTNFTWIWNPSYEDGDAMQP